MSAAGLWLITGAQASGKSTIADLLARRFDLGVHVRGGQFYRWAVNGWVHVDDAERRDEALRLLQLRYDLSASVADQYAAAGFTTVVQDNIYGAHVEHWLSRVRARPLRLVVLRPSVDVVEARDAERRDATGKVAYRGSFTPEINDEHLAATPREIGGLWLDTSMMTPEETVTTLLARQDDALVSLPTPGA
jgi:cytidylate kinase